MPVSMKINTEYATMKTLKEFDLYKETENIYSSPYYNIECVIQIQIHTHMALGSREI